MDKFVGYVFIRGLSMEPLLSTGDCAFYIKESIYNVGDIVVFNFDNKLIIHRIVDIKKGLYIIKGDNSYNVEIVKSETVLGKVNIIIKNNKSYHLKKSNFTKIIVELSKLVYKQWIKDNKNILITHRNWKKKMLNNILKMYLDDISY